MMRCAVCGQSTPQVCDWYTQGGTRYGMACPGECSLLLWESHWVRVTGATPDECALVVWKWRRRRAEVEAKPFAEPLPKSQAERELEVLLEARGWTEVAREVA